jgi:ribonuclease HII
MILGIDEVGRGPWAGPLVVGAVVLGGVTIDGLTDSKKLSKKRREELDGIIREKTTGIGLGWVSASEIDDIGLSAALVLATKRAVEQVKVPYHEIVIDGTVNFLKETNKGQYVTTMKKADLLVPTVSAASIVAKVARDAYMEEQDAVYPEYGFKSHVGYGTAMHIKAIETLGVTPLHRLSIAPLLKYAKKTITPQKPVYKGLSFARKTTKEIGDGGEDVAANYLVRDGHTIIDRNWKTKFCEIDIISLNNKTIYFTEVKYRKSVQQGGGIAAITPKKLRQMKFAVDLYSLKHQITDRELRLAAISVGGDPPEVEKFLEIV